MQKRLFSQKISTVNSFQWITTLIFCWIPILLLENESGLSLIEITIACAFAWILANWILKLIISKKSIYLRPLDIPIILFFSFIIISFVKVINGSIDLEDWLKWRKFLFLLIYFPISTQFTNSYRLRALIYSLICVGLLIALYDIITLVSQSSLFGDYFLRAYYKGFLIYDEEVPKLEKYVDFELGLHDLTLEVKDDLGFSPGVDIKPFMEELRFGQMGPRLRDPVLARAWLENTFDIVKLTTSRIQGEPICRVDLEAQESVVEMFEGLLIIVLETQKWIGLFFHILCLLSQY